MWEKQKGPKQKQKRKANEKQKRKANKQKFSAEQIFLHKPPLALNET